MDTLHVRLPGTTRFRPEFRDQVNAQIETARSSAYYRQVVDMRPAGRAAVLHFEAKTAEGDPRNHESKLELVDVGKKGFQEIKSEIENVIDGDPEQLEVMRVDLCADVPGVPIPWFREHMDVEHKQWVAHFGQYDERGKRVYQTLYSGKAPNCYRVYDKTAELVRRYGLEQRRAVQGAAKAAMADRFSEELAGVAYAPDCYGRNILSDFKRDYSEAKAREKENCPTFQEWTRFRFPPWSRLHGISANSIVTRVERQMGGGRVPAALCSVGRIERQLSRDFNPFSRVSLVVGEPEALNATRYLARRLQEENDKRLKKGKKPLKAPGMRPLQDYALGMLVNDYAKRFGRDLAESFVKLQINHASNFRRLWSRLEEFLPAGEGVTRAELYELYRDSMTRQLAA